MKKTVWTTFNSALAALLLLALSLNPHVASASDSKAFNIASYNLRYDSPKDGANAWPLRKEPVKALIRFHEFDILGTQEGLSNQIKDLAEMQEYAHIGVGRDDGKHAGEHSAIFYRRDRFSLIRHGDFWLSETPDIVSKGWDAECCNRIVSWAHLRDRNTGKTFFVFSVHFDHQGLLARRESAKLMLKKIKAIAGRQAVFCVGDFNSTPDTEQIATMRSALGDARELSATPAYGPEHSFNGFAWNEAPKDRIDYIFISAQIKVRKFATLSDSIALRYPSDHFALVARVLIP
jgi:endonuclease/exonuclease/phosphatase family metal-dependent hydrolase